MTKKYLIVKGAGGSGLGDCIRSLIVAILYAKLSNRTLHVDWKNTAYGSVEKNLFPELINLHEIPYITTMPKVNSVRPYAWKNRLQLSFNEVRALDGARLDGSDWNRQEAIKRYSFDLSQLVYPEDALVIWDFDQIDKLLPYIYQKIPDLTNRDNFEIQSLIMRRHISPNNDILQSVKDFFERNIQNKFIVGVHVRYTDESQKARKTPSLAQYLNAVRSFTLEEKEARIFLACDNISVLRQFIKTFGKEKVLYIDKWFPEAGVSIHKNPSCPDSFQVVKDALIDAYLLSKCHRLIVLHNSSFSSIARMWSDLPQHNINVLFPKLPFRTRIFKRLSQVINMSFNAC